MGLIYKIRLKLGVDRAILVTGYFRAVQALGGILSVFLITLHLTSVEQGFYFTFGSLLGIQVFFELGLNGIITQYVAHEVSELKLVNNSYVGETKYHSRLASLLHFCFKWYGILGVALFFILSITGFLFFRGFSRLDSPISWHIPWLLVSLGTTLSFLISPFMAFIEGLGKVEGIAKIRLIQQIGSMFTLWLGLLSGLKLYSGGVAVLVGVVLVFYLIIKKYRFLLFNISSTEVKERVSYRLEIFPLQWKIALSWVSGYFVFQLFNPFLFATEGAKIAGQMGMTLTLLNAILGLSLSWMTTKVPTFSNLIAKKQFKDLDILFDRTLLQSSLVNLFGLIGVLLLIAFIRYFGITIGGKMLGDSFLSFFPLIMMIFPVFLNHLISAFATYIRCHKIEPMLVQSITIGILSSASMIILGKYFGLDGIALGYMILSVVSLIWTFLTYKSSKLKMHK
jgi:hypothetical protein